MTQTTGPRLPAATGLIELQIGGMTCASCAARIEKKLNKLDGVTATVNYATEKARVEFPPTLAPQDLIATVEQTGYTARIPAPPAAATPTETTGGDGEEEQLRRLRLRLWVSVALAVPVVALAMIPALQFTNWQWLTAILAAPVVAYGGWPFHRPPGPTCATAPPPWTPSSRSAPSRRSPGPCGRCSSAPPANPA